MLSYVFATFISYESLDVIGYILLIFASCGGL